MLEYYAKVLSTETAYVPATEEQEEAEEAEFAESDAGVSNTTGGDKSAEEKRVAMTERSVVVRSHSRGEPVFCH